MTISGLRGIGIVTGSKEHENDGTTGNATTSLLDVRLQIPTAKTLQFSWVLKLECVHLIFFALTFVEGFSSSSLSSRFHLFQGRVWWEVYVLILQLLIITHLEAAYIVFCAIVEFYNSRFKALGVVAVVEARDAERSYSLIEAPPESC